MIETGLLAYGMSGRIFHAPFLAAHPGFRLRAVVERSRAQAAETYSGIHSYGSVAALLEHPEIELVVVNTPNDTHFELARQALHAGKHVLIEKPVATSVAELDELLALGRAAGRHVLAYHNRRYDSDFLAVRQVLASGQLGTLTEAHFRFDRYKLALNAKQFKEDPAVRGSGLSFDLGPHVLDQALSLFGPPRRVRKTLATHRPDSRVDDYFHVHLEYAGGLNVFVSGSLLVAAPGPAYVLHGTGGSFSKLRADVQETQLGQGVSPQDAAYGWEPAGAEGRLTVIAADGTKTESAVASPRGHYAGLFEAVYQTLRHGQPFPVRADELRGQLEVLAM